MLGRLTAREDRRMAGYDTALYRMYLANVPMFHKCTPEQLDLIAELGESVSLTEGQDAVREGDVDDGFFVVTSGSASVSRGGDIVATLAPGAYFGELSLFDPAPRNATVSAASGGLACVKMTRATFHQALDDIPAVSDALLHGMARRIHELDQRIC
jgi:CRP-like cAMP-binding protein